MSTTSKESSSAPCAVVVPHFPAHFRDLKLAAQVKQAANELIVSGISRKLHKFISEERLQPVQRQYIWREDQLASPSPAPEPVAVDALYEVGKVQRKWIKFQSGKTLPVITIVVADLAPQERNVIISDLANFRDFGCVNTQRLWGSIVSDTQITILLEDTCMDSLSTYVTTGNREMSELIKFARQMARVVDFFERTKFIHKRLSLDVCQLTTHKTLKVVVFGLSTGLIPKRIYLDDVERCRWMPWECLERQDGDPEPYDQSAVIWTLGTMIWSMFHKAAIPFENESVNQIRSREYRKDCQLDVIEELLPGGILEFAVGGDFVLVFRRFSAGNRELSAAEYEWTSGSGQRQTYRVGHHDTGLYRHSFSLKKWEDVRQE
ncbi:unnamed protein product [Nippostrongylus brasiliensis]|uniref:Protein kinase domain-containing protein n=1 Tax=Nippostrongylus brasiliensis TaxID=27835 RepID=A0A158QZ62_NIPBR|nr:unnamed protein product [Nippostrongylus brasiliensis]